MAPGRGASRQREDGEIADRRPSPNFHRHHTHPRGGGRGRGGPRGGGGPRGDRLDRGGGRGLRGGAPVVVVSRYADLADDGPPVTPGRRGLEQQQQQQRGGGGRPSGPGGRGGRGARGGRGRGGRGGGDNNSNKNQNMEPMRGGGGRWHERGGRGDARHARGRGDGRGNTSGRGGPRGGGDHQRPFKRRRSPSPTPPLLGKGISQRAQSFGSEGEILTDTELSPVQTPAQRPPDPPPMMNNIMRGNNSNHNNNRNNNFNAMRGNGPPQDSFRNNNNNNNFHNNANANRRNSTGDGSRSLNDDSASMARRTSMPVSHHGQSPRGPPVHDSYGRMALTPPPQQQQQARSRSSQPQHNNEESSLSSVRRSPGDESVSSRRPSGPTRTMDRNKEAQPLPSHSNSAVYDDSSTSTLNRPTNGGPSSNRPPPSSIDHNKSKDEPVRQRQQQRPPPPSSLSSPRPPPSTPHGVSRGTPVVRSYSNLPEEVVAAAAPRAGSGTVLPLPPAPQKQPPELPPQQNQQQPQAQPVSTTDGRQRHHDGSVESGPPRGASTSTTNVHQPPRPPVSEINMPPRPNNNKTTTTMMMMMGDRRGGGRSDDRGRLGMRGGRGGRSRGDFGRGNFGGRSDFFPDDMHSNKKFGGRVGGRGRGGDRGRGGGMDFGRGRGELGRGRAPIYSAMSAGSENEMNSFDGNMRGRGRGDFRGGRGGRGRDDFGRGRGRDSFDLRSGRERGMEFGMRDPGFNNDSFSFEGGGRGRGFGRTGGRGRADFTSVRQLPPPNSISVPQPQHRGKGGLNEQRAREMGHQARDATSRIFDQPFDQRFHNNGDPMGQSPFPQRNQNHDESDRQTFRSLDETRPESSNARDPNKATPQSSTEPSIAKSETVGTSANGMDVSPQQGSATESKMEESLAPPLICTPPPGEPSRLTLALTRLADLEAQMEFEFVKHSQLVLDQKKIRAEYETLLGMPVGKESFQSDYDLLIGETEQSQ